MTGKPKFYCQFNGCKMNTLHDVHMYRFPKDINRCKAWVDACNNPKLSNISPSKLYVSNRICHKHFQDWCFMNVDEKRHLVHNAIPNSPKPSPKVQQVRRPPDVHDGKSGRNVQKDGHPPNVCDGKSGRSILKDRHPPDVCDGKSGRSILKDRHPPDVCDGKSGRSILKDRHPPDVCDGKSGRSILKDRHPPDVHDKTIKDCKPPNVKQDRVSNICDESFENCESYQDEQQDSQLNDNILDEKNAKDCKLSSAVTDNNGSMLHKLLVLRVLPQMTPTANPNTVENVPVSASVPADVPTLTPQKRSLSEPESPDAKKPKVIYKMISGPFPNHKNLKQFIKIHPHLTGKVLKDLTYHCHLCPNKFKAFKSLTCHLRKKHSLPLPKIQRSPKLHRCPLCEVSFPKGNMSHHLQHIHKVRLVIEEKEFGNFQEFLLWKSEVEGKTDSKYGYVCQKKTTGMLHRRYACHFSSQYVCREKVPGGNDEDLPYCPASIDVYVRNGECKVTYCSTHIGHPNEMGDSPVEQEYELNDADIATYSDESSNSSALLNESIVSESSVGTNPVISVDNRESLLKGKKTDELKKANTVMVRLPERIEDSNESRVSLLDDKKLQLKRKKIELMVNFQDILTSISNDKEAEVVKNMLRSIQPILEAMRS